MGHLIGSASAEIDAGLEQVWAVVQDVMRAPEWQGGLDKLTALERGADGRPTLVDSESDIKIRRVNARVRIHYEDPTRLSWVQESGDLKSLKAVWGLEDVGNGRTRVSYVFEADLGRVLGLLLRGPVLTATQAIFVNGRPGELRRRVEAWRVEPG
jgi:carbon monoxide dehydrogenase subunit G